MISPEVQQLHAELVALRRQIHAEPELAYQEHATAQRIAAFLEGSEIGRAHV